MVTILSAFLGLAVGVHPVEVDPTGDVVAVEFVLDGVSVGVLDAEPWVVDCDFGPEMAPHELVVIGRDSDGQEIARASRWINLPRHSEAGWRAIAGAGSEESDLTTLVFELQGRNPPAPSEMEGWLRKDGKALEVVAVERGGADIVVVQEATLRLWGDLLKVRRGVLESGDRNALKERLSSGLNYRDRLRVMLPVGETQAGGVAKFHISADFSEIDYGPTTSGSVRRSVAGARAYGVLATFPYPPESSLRADTPRRTADAVAIAALEASGANRARAVVLVREAGTRDHSQHDPDAVRRYLDRLQVPLAIWFGGSSRDDGLWGQALKVSTPERFLRAVRNLREVLDSQVVVRVRGRHLVQQVELSSSARELLRPVGREN